MTICVTCLMNGRNLAVVLGIACLLLLIIFIFKNRRPNVQKDFFDLEEYSANNKYERGDFSILEPELMERSHFLSKSGQFSALFSNQALPIKYIVTIVEDGPPRESMLPIYTVLILQGKDAYCKHCLAFSKKSRENRSFGIIYGDRYNSLDLDPNIQFYSNESFLDAETIRTIADLSNYLGDELVCIECIGNWLLVYLHQIPERRNAIRIFDFLQHKYI